MTPTVVVLLLLLGLVEAVEGQQQQASPGRVAWADSKVDLIKRPEQRGHGYAPSVREAGETARISSGQSKSSFDNNNKNNNNNNNVERKGYLPLDLRRWEILPAPPGEPGADHNGHVAGSTVTVRMASPGPIPASSPPERERSEGPPSRRRLQTDDDGSCEVGGDFTVSSTVYRSANGCYIAYNPGDPYFFVSSDDVYVSVGDRLVVPYGSLVGPTTTLSSSFEDFWVMAEVYEVTNAGVLLAIECASSEAFVEGSHPADVTSWTCYIGGGYQVVADETFGITCGCDEGATPSPAGGPTPVDADSPRGVSGCGGTDPFAIVSAQLPDLDGCYEDTGGDDGDTFFSATGEKEDGVLAVYPGAIDEQSFDLRWIVGTYSVDAESAITTCVSDEEPSVAHPADATFYCDLTGTGAYTTVSEDQFDIVCGCNSTAPTNLNAATPSPSESGAENAVTGGTPSPADAGGGLLTADDSSGGYPVAPARGVWLPTAVAATAAAAAVFGTVLTGLP